MNAKIISGLATLLVMMVLPVLSKGQQVVDTWDRSITESLLLGKDGRDGLPSNVKGSPFLFSDWRQGVVEFADGKKSEPYTINLDIYQREVVIRKPGSDMEFGLNLKDVAVIYITDTETGQESRYIKLKKDQFEGSAESKDFMYEALDSHGVLVRNTLSDLDQPEKGAYASGKDYPEFKNYENLYLKGGDGLYYTFNGKKGRLKKILGDDKSQSVLDYLENNKLDLKSEADIAKALDSVNKN